jgi:hypothetical protein
MYAVNVICTFVKSASRMEFVCLFSPSLTLVTNVTATTPPTGKRRRSGGISSAVDNKRVAKVSLSQ